MSHGIGVLFNGQIIDADKDKGAIERQAKMRADLANLFPVRRIFQLTMEQGELRLGCELPDYAELVPLPLVHMNIVQPEMVMRFLARSDAVLNVS
jgi:hypothetical protein